MSEEEKPINANEIVAKLLVETANQTLSRASKPLLDRARRTFHLISNAYSSYLESTFLRVRNIKTFLKPNEPIDLLSVYIPATFSDGRKQHDAAAIVNSANANGRIVISGLAGRGKSVMMRYIALSMYHAPQGKIPLFLELRSLNGDDGVDILRYIHEQYRGRKNISFEDFCFTLSQGYFCLILDGFDEIHPELRSRVEDQILKISSDYPEAAIAVSSRPDTRFQSWQDFQERQICPMSLPQARRLITKSVYDEDVKKIFKARLTKSFFEKHESFLSTPLLAIMMMLTFEEYAEIPTSLHAFYKNAFDTLIRRHDATKPRFVRKIHSNCTADEFQRIFSSFCLLTYSKSKYEFNEAEVLNYLSAALRQQQIVADPKCVLHDLIESICLLQKEGFEISFVHRSFQEYFCALFISLSSAGLLRQYLDTGKYKPWDDMIPMLYGMARDRFEQEWSIEVVKAIISKYQVGDKLSSNYIADRFSNMYFHLGGKSTVHISLDDSNLSRQMAVLQRVYKAHFEGTRTMSTFDDRQQKEWNENVRKELIQLKQAGDERLAAWQTTASDFELKLTSSDVALMAAIGFIDLAKDELSALLEIQKDQLERLKQEDVFLKSVFAGIPA